MHVQIFVEPFECTKLHIYIYMYIYPHCVFSTRCCERQDWQMLFQRPTGNDYLLIFIRVCTCIVYHTPSIPYVLLFIFHFTDIYLYIYMCICIYIYTCTQVHTHIYIYICICVHVRVCLHIYLHMNIYV